MANLVEYFFNTEAAILALTPTDEEWVNMAFYYPNDKEYYYRIIDGIMQRSTAGIGVKVNGFLISGSKQKILGNETLEVPEGFEYNTHRLDVDGIINCDGEINIL